jgi:hypothetical protein
VVVSEDPGSDADRAISTTLDATLALVLMSAAVLTVAFVPPPAMESPHDSADRTADLLGSATTVVNYSLAPGARFADPDVTEFPVTGGPEFRRTAHGTLAELLARAAVGNLAVDGAQVTHTSDRFERGVEERTRSAVSRPRVHVGVVAVWRPYPEADVRGRVAVGNRPPPTADVHGATLSVPGPFPPVGDRVVDETNRSDYRGVAETLANATVSGLFPVDRTRFALQADYPVRRLVRHRYRRAGALFTPDEGNRPFADGAVPNATTANRQLTRTLADRYETDLRERYPTARAAARDVTVGRVVITVRTWSA